MNISNKLLKNSEIKLIILSEAKLYLRVNNNIEDSLINDLIKSAINVAEDYLKIAINDKYWCTSIGNFTGNMIRIDKYNLREIKSIKFIKNNEEKIIDKESYILYEQDIIFNKYYNSINLIINYTTGYDKSESVPFAIKQAILAHIALIYDDRTNGIAIPSNITSLYQPYRKILL